MSKKLFLLFLIIIISLAVTIDSFAQKRGKFFNNPFLTSEEEMRERGIKPLQKIKLKIELSQLKLTGIFFSEEKKFAIINSNFYTEGDEIGNYRIERIERERIILSDGERKEELKLKHVLEVSEKEQELQEEKEEQAKEELAEEKEEK